MLVLLAACSGGHRRAGHTAAEPATAPALSTTPAGTVRAVGVAPEGIVYAPASNLVAIAVRNPDRLLLLDATTLALRRSVPLPGHARHLQLAGPDTVLVPAEDSNLLVEVSLPGGATTMVKVGTSPHDAARTSDGRIVAGDEFGASLTVVGADGAVERTITEVQQPGGVIADGATVAVVDVKAYTVSTFNPATGARTGIVDAGAGPTHGVLVPGHRLAVADTRGNGIQLFTLSPLASTGVLDLPGSPYGLATVPTTGTVWATLTGRNEVVGLDVSGDVAQVIARYPTVEQPDTVAVAPGSHTLWVTGTKAGVVERITR